MENENYAEMILREFPTLVFAKTDREVTEENRSELAEALIPDCDMPADLTGKKIFPLPVTAFPSVLSRMTASQAGWWAINRCRNVRWELSMDNILCCLAHLEMDMP